MDSIKEMHKSIQDSIMEMQKKTVRMLENQERDLIRDFKTKLIAVEQELFKERKKNENGSVEWVEKCHKLTSELEWLRDTAKKLSEENKNINKEMRRLRKTLKQKEEDREYLIKQLVDVKKENQKIASVRPATSNPVPPAIARLERPYTAALDSSALAKGATSPLHRSSSDLEDPFTVGSRRASPKGTSFTAQQERRYKNVIARLKRQVEAEQTKIKKIRAQYRAEISARNELQTILKMCVMDVRQAANLEGSEGSLESKRQNLALEERIQIIERLMSNDKVVYLLYERMFPGRKAENIAVDQLLQEMDKESRNYNPEEMQHYTGWVESKLSKHSSRGGASVPASSRVGSRPVSRTGTKKLSRKTSARYLGSSARR
mmetsp:Transcript_7837/g.15299  ORF Transcript_7837/g.15299 Transcript_7837/m.15299 type:complete len:376 (+) Transcript_7837:335-1462(+)